MQGSAFIAVSLLATTTFVLAEDAPDFAAATLGGDWSGARSDLWRCGTALHAGVRLDSLHNRGGVRHGTETVNHLELKLRADLEKRRGLDSTVAYFNNATDGGTGINAQRTGSLTGVGNIEVPVSATRLVHAWVQKGFLDDRLSVLAGIYPIDSEFFTMDLAATLLHPAYRTPADLVLTNAPSAFNNATFGIRAKWLAENRALYAMGEIGWMPLESGHGFEAVDPADVKQTPELVAHEKYEGISKYAVGFRRYGNKVPDQFDVDADNKPRQRHSQGGNVLAERSLVSLGGETGRDVTAFGRYAFSAGDSTAIDRMETLGMRIRGPLAGRPDNSLAIGWTHSRFASKWRSAQRAAGTATADNDDAFEITWRITPIPWRALQPDIRNIRRNPGGTSGT